MNNDNIIADTNYEEITNNATGVILFYKKLCPNCKAIEKMLEKYFTANPEILHWSIDSEESPEAMKKLDIEKVPTLIILKDGQVTAKKVGLMNVKEMTEFYRKA